MSNPILSAFTLLHIGEKQFARRTHIGTAWPQSQRAGYTVALDAVPLDGRFILVPQDETDGTP